MAEDRKQSPHYIPELDPENAESGPKLKQRLLWTLVGGGFFCVMIGGLLYAFGFERAGLVVIGIGVLLLAPILFWVGI